MNKYWPCCAHRREAVPGRLDGESCLNCRLVAGIGNIYANESLFRARISPRRAANRLTATEVRRLWSAIRQVLAEAIARGSTVPLNFGGGKTKGLFYLGPAPDGRDFRLERLWVYGRAGEPCRRCGRPVKRMVQGARSTFYCPRCQGAGKSV